MTFFPNAQQKASRLEVGGLGVRKVTRNLCGVPASIRKASKIVARRGSAMKTHRFGVGRCSAFATNPLITNAGNSMLAWRALLAGD